LEEHIDTFIDRIPGGSTEEKQVVPSTFVHPRSVQNIQKILLYNVCAGEASRISRAPADQPSKQASQHEAE